MCNKSVEKVVIIGSGPAGLTSAIYCARANLNPVVIAGKTLGGMLTKTNTVENFPGFSKMVPGFKIMSTIQEQAQRFGSRILYDSVSDVNLSGEDKVITLASGNTLLSKSIIIATGSEPKSLNIPSEDKFLSRGLSHCAVCDGGFFKDMSVVVVGGGDTAISDVTFLSRMTNDLTLIHRREELRASKYSIGQLERFNLKTIWNTVVLEFIGDDYLEQLKIKNIKTGETSIIKCSGCFLALGNYPSTDIFKDKVDMDYSGYIITLKNSTHTNVPGVFAAGDCVDKNYRQAVVAAGMGCKAAIDAEKWL